MQAHVKGLSDRFLANYKVLNNQLPWSKRMKWPHLLSNSMQFSILLLEFLVPGSDHQLLFDLLFSLSSGKSVAVFLKMSKTQPDNTKISKTTIKVQEDYHKATTFCNQTWNEQQVKNKSKKETTKKATFWLFWPLWAWLGPVVCRAPYWGTHAGSRAHSDADAILFFGFLEKFIKTLTLTRVFLKIILTFGFLMHILQLFWSCFLFPKTFFAIFAGSEAFTWAWVKAMVANGGDMITRMKGSMEVGIDELPSTREKHHDYIILNKEYVLWWVILCCSWLFWTALFWSWSQNAEWNDQIFRICCATQMFAQGHIADLQKRYRWLDWRWSVCMVHSLVLGHHEAPTSKWKPPNCCFQIISIRFWHLFSHRPFETSPKTKKKGRDVWPAPGYGWLQDQEPLLQMSRVVELQAMKRFDEVGENTHEVGNTLKL